MDTKCIKVRPIGGRTRLYEKKKEGNMVISKPENKIPREINTKAIKKPWKKPVLMCGKKISLFDIQINPPDDFS